MFRFGECCNFYNGFFGFGVSHLGGEGAVSDEAIEFFLIFILAGNFLFNVGGADGFVGFLGAGGFGFEVANLKIFFAEILFNIMSGHGDSLLGEVKTIGAMISNHTSLVKGLGGGHGGAGGKTEPRVGFDLHRGRGKGRTRLAGARAGGNVGNGKVGLANFFEIFSGGFLGVESLVEDGGKLVFVFGLEFASDLELGFAGEIFDFFLAFDDEAKSWRLDAPGRDSARDFAADDARKVIPDEHIKGLASLLRSDHIHVDGAGILDGSFEGGFGDFVESNAFRSLRKFQDFH